MPRKDRPTDPAEIQRSIEEAIQELVSKGLVVAREYSRNAPSGPRIQSRGSITGRWQREQTATREIDVISEKGLFQQSAQT
jgi:hypothetical protein